MAPKETKRQRVDRVAQELSPQIRQQARGRWKEVQTAQRNEQGRHVWRFRPGPGEDERFLHIDHQAMVRGEKSAERVLNRLEEGRWLDRLQKGPETSLLLSRSGELGPLGDR
jgi:hypothetical protein